MSDQDLNRRTADVRAGRDDAPERRPEPPLDELGDDALEDVAGGAACATGTTIDILPKNSTV